MSNPTRHGAPRALDDATLDGVTGGAKMGFGEGGPAEGGEGGRGDGTNDYVGGTFMGDLLTGGGGDDTIMGHGGNDLIAGGTGADLIDAGAGDDRISWSQGQGNDTINGGDGTDTLMLHVPDMSLEELLASIEVAEGSAAPFVNGATINLAGVTGTLVIGDERISFSNLESLRLMKNV